MDVTALLVFVSGFVVCAGAVFFFSIFGAKEETFEEALAKQRKANEKEKKSKDKKKENDNINKKSKNWRMKKKGERDDKQDGLVSVMQIQFSNDILQQAAAFWWCCHSFHLSIDSVDMSPFFGTS